MPSVDIKMFAGRTLDQKRALVRSVTDAVVESLGVRADAVSVRITETTRENSARGGTLHIDSQK
jgi:4-oxalocrotonate tautomerase